MLKREVGTAQNIKDKKTRKRVLKALNKMIYRISNMDVSENGFYVYANHKDVWVVVPEYKNPIDNYTCGKSFRTDYLESPGEPVGKIYLSTKEAIIVKDFASSQEQLYHLTSGIPSKHSKGGQSQNRFHRKREEAIKAFLRRVKQKVNEVDIEKWLVLGESRLVTRYLKDS